MTRTTSIGAWSRHVTAVAAAAGATALVTLAAAPAADASFTTGQCQGSGLTARGASFQTAAHLVFKPSFETGFCASQGSAPNVNYTGGGSGLGRRHMGERTSASGAGENNLNGSLSRSYPERFTGTDEPLTANSKSQIEQGTDAAGDESPIHQIPVAGGAVSAIVNFPDNCNVESIPVANQSDPRRPGETDAAYATRVQFTNRARFTKAQWERIWNGAQSGGEKASTWGDTFPGLTAIVGNSAGKTDAQCQAQQMTRVVRFDDSGTSYAFKDALNAFRPSRGWLTDFTINPDTRNWPNASIDDGSACNGGVADPNKKSPVGVPGPGGTPSLVTGCANGNNNLVPKLRDTDGSVGYSDLATTIITGGDLRITPTTNIASRDDDKYLTQLPNGQATETFVESTRDPNGFKSNNSVGTRGANCAGTVYRNVPSSTLGDWSNASGVDSPTGWGICTLTYALAFDDDAKAYPNSPDGAAAEEGKARTVKDYLGSAVATTTQNELEAGNYSPLPAGIRTISQTGVNSIDWNKSGTAGGGGGGGGGGVANPGATSPPAGGGFTPPVAKPSNLFSVPRVSLSSKAGTATLSVRLPGAGRLVMEATAKVKVKVRGKTRTKTIRVGKVTRTVSKAGLVKLTVKPSSAARAVLRRTGKLKVSVKLTYTPRGGTARSSKKTITLRLKKPAKRGKR